MNEKWEEVYTSEQLIRLQKIEYELLLVVVDICNKLGLTYVLYGGTLLGAYKYGGFIPWDDDVDIAMPRADYVVFCNKASAYLPEKYSLQTPYNDKKSPFPYCKLRIKGTRYIEKYHHKLDIEQGIYVDIYPIDDIPDNEQKRLSQFRKCQFLLKLFFFKQCLHVDNETPIVTRIKHTLAFIIMKIIPQSYLMTRIDSLFGKYNLKGFKRCSCLYYPNEGNYYDSFYPLKKLEFNGKSFNVPNDYEMHLHRRYGNVDQLPPEENRIGHVPYIFDLGEYKDGGKSNVY